MNFLAWLMGYKAAPNYTARAGETIAGNLKRGGDGKFTSGGSASTEAPAKKPAAAAPAKPAPKPVAKPEPKKAAPKKKPARTRAQYNAERAARKKARLAKIAAQRAAKKKLPKKPAKPAATTANQKKVMQQTLAGGIGPKSFGVMNAIRDGKKPDPKTLAILSKSGLVTADGKLTPAGKKFMDASDKGDTKGALAAVRAARPSAKKPRPPKKPVASGKPSPSSAPVKKEAPAFAVFKDASGQLRWISRSSTAFQDRDQEIVSTKALATDVERADTDGAYGPLRFWHMPGVDVGDCDFNVLVGRTLIESGTFRHHAIGERVKATADQWELSIGFLHPPTEPISGVFHTIRRFERSLVPKGRASNLFTGLAVLQEKNDMATPEEKMKAFELLVGDPDVMRAILNQAATAEKTADLQNIAFKETTEAETVKAEGDVAIDDVAEDAAEDVVDEVFVGDMTATELRDLLTEVVAASMTGMSAEATKAAGELTAIKDQQTKTVQAQQQHETATTKEIADLKATIKQAQQRLDALEGDQPRALQQRRASQSDSTVLGDDSTLKAVQPQVDPLNSFVGGFLLGTGQ